MFAQQVGQWRSAGARQQEIKAGAVFRKEIRGGIIEIAKVIDIAADSMGVRHVRFVVSIQNSHRQCFREQRTLGLATFSEMFPIGGTETTCADVEKGLRRSQNERQAVAPRPATPRCLPRGEPI